MLAVLWAHGRADTSQTQRAWQQGVSGDQSSGMCDNFCRPVNSILKSGTERQSLSTILSDGILSIIRSSFHSD